MSNPDHADVPVRRDYGDIDEQFTTGTGRTAREQPYWRSSLARTKELENQMRLQMEYEASRNTWQSGWVVGRGGVPVRPEAGRGGPIVVQGTTAGQVAGHTAGLPPASAQHQHEGNTFLEWHYLRNNPTAPLADEEELIQEDLERMGIDPEAAAARGALPHVPTPVPSDQVQRVEGFVKESTYLMFCILIGTDLNAMNREEVVVLELVSRVSKCPRGCCRGPKPERLGGASEGGETPGRMQRTLQCTSFKVRQGLQALGIMLDDELLEITVPSRVRLRVNTNFRSHLQVQGKAKGTKELMARADQLEEGVPSRRGDRLPKETDSSYGDQVTKLNELLIREDFFEERSDLETRLDAVWVRRGYDVRGMGMPARDSRARGTLHFLFFQHSFSILFLMIQLTSSPQKPEDLANEPDEMTERRSRSRASHVDRGRHASGNPRPRGLDF